MSWARVRAWRDALRRRDPSGADTGLSPEGARAAWTASLDALHDEALEQVAALEGEPFDDAVLVAARTVVTAPLEWCAVLLGRGTRQVLKHPRGAPGLAPLLAEEAARVGLPLLLTDAREAVGRAELVIAMGADATAESVRAAARPDARVLAFGHRFSVAWVGDDDPASWAAVAGDAALHDGRGCFSPVAVLTPVEGAVDRLAEAMAEAERRWPRGRVAPVEAAETRRRRALARVVGDVREGEGWSVHGLPAARWTPGALPRSLAVVQVSDDVAARALLDPWWRWLSTVGTSGAPGALAGAPRVCALGQMQRPPLVRRHDGVEHLRLTLR